MKTTQTQAVSSGDAPADQVFDVTLSEWCRDASVADKRVELIGAFYRTETAAGRVHGSPSAFATRYDAFVNTPA